MLRRVDGADREEGEGKRKRKKKGKRRAASLRRTCLRPHFLTLSLEVRTADRLPRKRGNVKGGKRKGKKKKDNFQRSPAFISYVLVTLSAVVRREKGGGK